MADNLIIVESPAKVKTIKKFLGSNYDVEASGGHVRDLPKSKMGIDIENGFAPNYITIRGKGDLVSDLRKKAKKAKTVYLATDPDREGEAIAWHLKEALSLPDAATKRITFNEITKTAVKESLKNPRSLDEDLIDAQQARRVLDRLVGYSISPLLWRKVKRGLSAGRVQSATLCMIASRDEEIAAFVPEEYWTIDAAVTADGKKKPVTLHVNDKEKIPDKETADRIAAELRGAVYTVSDIRTTQKVKKAPLPYTTSTLQQDASRVLNLSPQKTMRVAQQLYEGISLKGNGTVGIITYLRTDSVRIADEADAAARDYVGGRFGEAYAAKRAGAANKGRSQDAHEAIRPTDVTRTPEMIKDSLDRDQLRLYRLIWNRFVASRMADSVAETVTVKVTAAGHVLTASSTRTAFDGFKAIYDYEEKEKKDGPVESLTQDSVLELQEVTVDQHFTSGPAHYTEASLVHAMEECGIGRPSTYAPTIALLLGRHYIAKEGRNLFVTELGEAVNKIMVDHFPNIADQKFTARMEDGLDRVAEGTEDWHSLIGGFYPGFAADLEKAEAAIGKIKVADEVSDVPCERCGRMMVIKYGPHGKFLACPGFPECRNTKPYLEKTGLSCPKCGGDVIVRKTQKGRRYYGCSNYPDCDYMSWSLPKKEG